jgi:hypothetical protein
LRKTDGETTKPDPTKTKHATVRDEEVEATLGYDPSKKRRFTLPNLQSEEWMKDMHMKPPEPSRKQLEESQRLNAFWKQCPQFNPRDHPAVRDEEDEEPPSYDSSKE